MENQKITKIVVDSWYSTIKRATILFEGLTDEDMLNNIAPNRNRGIYILGHLTAINDMLLPLLNIGNQLYPELKKHFIKTPDNADLQTFTVAQLRQFWTEINAELQKHFDSFNANDWLQKHNAVSEEDFAKEPHRNKLNVVLSRTNHLSYHLGQLILLKE